VPKNAWKIGCWALKEQWATKWLQKDLESISSSIHQEWIKFVLEAVAEQVTEVRGGAEAV